jgi:hypothetical protein
MPRLQFEERFLPRKQYSRKLYSGNVIVGLEDHIDGISCIPRLGVNENLDIDIFPSFPCGHGLPIFVHAEFQNFTELTNNKKQNLIVVFSAFHFMLWKLEGQVAN